MRRKIRPVCLCRDCENTVSRPGYLYCSNRCQQEHQHHEYVKAWLVGDKDGARAVVEVSYHVKRWLKDTYGEKCCHCGWAETNPHTGRIPLHLNHIDGNWRNSRPENLRLLCPNCYLQRPELGKWSALYCAEESLVKAATTIGLWRLFELSRGSLALRYGLRSAGCGHWHRRGWCLRYEHG